MTPLTLLRIDKYQTPKNKFGNKRPGIPCGKSYISWRKKCSEGQTAVARKRLKGTDEGKAYAARVRASKGLKKAGPDSLGLPPVAQKIIKRLEDSPVKGSYSDYIKKGLNAAPEFFAAAQSFDPSKVDELKRKKFRIRTDNATRRDATAAFSKLEKTIKGEAEISRLFKLQAETKRRADDLYEKFRETPSLDPSRGDKRGAYLVVATEASKLEKKVKTKMKAQRKEESEFLRTYADSTPEGRSIDKEIEALSRPAVELKRRMLESRATIVPNVKAPSKSKDPTVRDEIRDFATLTQGRAKTLKTVSISTRRAHAVKSTGVATYGGPADRGNLWHEMAHHLEFSEPALAQAAADWRLSRASSDIPRRLSALTGSKHYNSKEVALPDDFITPYVGKVYGAISGVSLSRATRVKSGTEVISMGLEHFAKPESMMRLAKKDPEHFALILGILEG